MTQVGEGGYKSFQAAVEKLPGDDGHDSGTASHTSLCQCGLHLRAGLFTSHLSVNGGGVPADPVTQQTNQACKCTNKTKKTRTGKNVSGDS